MLPLSEIRDLFARALELPAHERLVLLAGLSQSVRNEVESLLRAHESAGSFLDSGALDPFAPGQRVGPYRIHEELGRGGMGIVYRAVRDDGEFHREVAVKVVGGLLFAPEAERRFLAERNILAALDHPNIVRMLDGGVWNQQRYLVMEYVDGRPITEYCRQRELPLNERLRLFQTLCSAIQYAHVRMILHRDLKAANILVNLEGTVKVLDFGIAQLMESQSPAGDTTVLHPFTTSCASPEQLHGERLTLASDIYALGLLLCELSTGANPQDGLSPADILRKTESSGSVLPAKLEGGISRDLDAIVRKSLAADPALRYGSAGELSADIERFLEHRPVIAHAPSPLYLAARICTRNKALTAVVLALILAIFGGVAAVAWQARRANLQRALAESRFNNARRLIYTVIHDIQPQMAAINGTVSLRKAMVEKTLVYLEAIWQDSAASPALTRELIDSYVTLASVAADPATANVGDQRRASEILAKAERLADSLSKSAPLESSSLITLCNFDRAMARNAIYYQSSDRGEAYARRAVAAAEKLAAIRPPDPRAPEILANALLTLAAATKNEKERIPLFERALPIYRSLYDRDPSDPHARNLALVYKNLASAWEEVHSYQQSLDAASQARSIDERVLKRSPASPEARMALAFDLGAIGLADDMLGRPKDAAEAMGQNVTLRKQLVSLNPDDRRAKDRLAYALFDLAEVEHELHEAPAARRDLQQALQLYRTLAEQGPLVPQSLYRDALAHATLAAMEIERGSKSQGCAIYRQGVQLLDEYRQRNPSGKAGGGPAFQAGAASCGGVRLQP